MGGTKILLLAASALAPILPGSARSAHAFPEQGRIVRLAELEIEPAQLVEYKAALKVEIETSIRDEPGVLALFAVAVKDHPAQVRLFEVYADAAAYEAHLRSSHFNTYKNSTRLMVRSLRLLETDPILLGIK